MYITTLLNSTFWNFIYKVHSYIFLVLISSGHIQATLCKLMHSKWYYSKILYLRTYLVSFYTDGHTYLRVGYVWWNKILLTTYIKNTFLMQLANYINKIIIHRYVTSGNTITVTTYICSWISRHLESCFQIDMYKLYCKGI